MLRNAAIKSQNIKVSERLFLMAGSVYKLHPYNSLEDKESTIDC